MTPRRLILVIVALMLVAPTAPAGERRDRFGDPLPKGAVMRVGTARLRLGDSVSALAGSPDGKFVAALEGDQVAVWAVSSGRELYRYRCSARDDCSKLLVFTPDSQSLLFADARQIMIADLATAKCRTLSKTPGYPHIGAVTADGKRLTVVLRDPLPLPLLVLQQLDLATGKCVRETRWQSDESWALDDLPRLSVRWQISRTGRLVAALEEYQAAGTVLRVCAADSGAVLYRQRLDKPPVSRMAFSHDERQLVIATTDSVVRVVDTATWKEVHRAAFASNEYLSDGPFVVSRDGQSLFGLGKGGLSEFSLLTGKRTRQFATENAERAIPLHGNVLAVANETGDIELWDLATGKQRCADLYSASEVAFSPDSRFAAWAEEKTLVIADAQTGKETHRWPADAVRNGSLVAFAPVGQRLAIGSEGGATFWNVFNGRKLGGTQGADVNEVSTSLQFAADGSRLAIGGPTDLSLWDTRTGAELGRWKSRRDFPPLLLPGMNLVALADEQAGTVRLVAAGTGRKVRQLADFGGRAGYWYELPDGTACSFGNHPMPLHVSPDGQRLLAMGNASVGNVMPVQALYLWDLTTGRRLSPELWGHTVIPKHVSFSPDSRSFALQRSDCTVCLLSADTGAEVRCFGRCRHVLTAPPVFTPDGRLLITVVGDLIRIWEIATGGELCQRTGHQGEIRKMWVSPDGRRLATAAADHTILVWDLEQLLVADTGAQPPNLAKLEALWRDLASPDAPRGRQALENLVLARGAAVELLRDRLKPVPTPDGKQLARWLADLSSDDYATRAVATEAIERLGDVTTPALRAALERSATLEQRRRIEMLLRKADDDGPGSPQALRPIRAVQVLEALRTRPARELLQALAAGAPGARLTTAAAAALQRLGQTSAAR